MVVHAHFVSNPVLEQSWLCRPLLWGLLTAETCWGLRASVGSSGRSGREKVLLGSSSDPAGADSPVAWAWERSESSPMVPSHVHMSVGL